MERNLYITFIAIFISLTANSQIFMSEAGIRGGFTSGFTYRQYLNDYLSYEGIVSYRNSGYQFTLLRQVHEMNTDFNVRPNLHFLYGFGGHIGFFFADNYRAFGRTEQFYNRPKFTPVLGVDAYTALEYRVESFPLVIGLDYKPFFEFSVYEFFKMKLWDFAFSARYRF